MNTYLVTLADRNTGEDQRILVQSSNSDDMQQFVDSDKVRPTLALADPVVIAIHQLRVSRPHRTVLSVLEKTQS
jgi:hypothetical protein